MSELPPGWVECEFGDVAQIVGGSTPPSKDPANFDTAGGFPWITPADLSGYRGMYIARGSRSLTQKGLSASSAQLLPPGTVLFSSRAPIGYVAIASNPVTTNQGFKSFVLPKGIEPRFVYHYLRYIKPIAEARATGTTFKELSGASTARLPLQLAPIREQTRIADKLDALVARVDACRERLDRVPTILKSFRQSILDVAANGELTREWREVQGRALDWTRTSVAEVSAQVFDGPFGSHLKSKDYVASGVRVVRLENIAPLRFVEEKRTYISREKYTRLTRHTLLTDDILFSSFVDEEVRVCLLPAHLHGKAINKADCFCIRTNPLRCRARFLALRLACKSTFDALDEAIHGATRPRINLSQLREIAFDLPSIDEQDEIVRRCNALLALADDIERHLEAARGYVESITSRILAKAFRGELVPQDPRDEPAGELLVEVQKQRLAAKVELQRSRPKGVRKKSTMNITDNDALKAAILRLNTDSFSFDELRAQVGGDYESVKDALFELLQESKPVVRQVFDKNAKTMQLVRVRR